MEIDLNKRHQTMVVLWFALLMSIGSFFVFTRLAAPTISNAPRETRNPAVIVALVVFGILLVGISFLLKRKFLQKSVEKQDIGLVQQGMVLACAICEFSALLGVVDHFLIGDPEYYLLLVIGATGTVLHFPRREQLSAASPKIPISRASS